MLHRNHAVRNKICLRQLHLSRQLQGPSRLTERDKNFLRKLSWQSSLRQLLRLFLFFKSYRCCEQQTWNVQHLQQNSFLLFSFTWDVFSVHVERKYTHTHAHTHTHTHKPHRFSTEGKEIQRDPICIFFFLSEASDKHPLCGPHCSWSQGFVNVMWLVAVALQFYAAVHDEDKDIADSIPLQFCSRTWLPLRWMFPEAFCRDESRKKQAQKLLVMFCDTRKERLWWRHQLMCAWFFIS